jgi:hypothetical protein
LRQVATLYEAVNLKRKLCLQKLLLGMRKAQISENVPAALFDRDWLFRFRGSRTNSALLCVAVRPRLGAAE